MRALERFGFSAGDFEVADFTQRPSFLSFAAGEGWFDLMTQVPGIDFTASYANQTIVLAEAMALRFVDLASLRRNKAATGRAKALADLENLPLE